MDVKTMEFIRKNEDSNIVLEYRKIACEGNMIEFPLLQFTKIKEIPFVEHCFTTRGGGVSEGIFASLNLSFSRGDNNAHVLENYNRLAKALGVTADCFVCSDQTHTTNVLRVGKTDCGIGVTREKPYTDVDGLITNEPNVVLSTFYADCVPLYFVDPVHKAIGLSHSGWRGTVGRMGQRTLEAMRQEFGTNPKDVYAAVGPSICQDCYEVSGDVAKAFLREFAGHEYEILKRNDPKKKDNFENIADEEKFQLNLWECNRLILLEAGITPEHLSVTNICTCCNDKILFSHRASKGKRGNLGAFLYLKEGY